MKPPLVRVRHETRVRYSHRPSAPPVPTRTANCGIGREVDDAGLGNLHGFTRCGPSPYAGPAVTFASKTFRRGHSDGFPKPPGGLHVLLVRSLSRRPA